jgi:DNA-binding NarL/FixJ family response regulator
MHPTRQEQGNVARPIRVLIFDEQSLVRAGLRVMLEACPDFEVVADTGDSASAVQLADELVPDIVAMEVRLASGDGMAVLARIVRGCPPRPRVLVVTNVAVAECVFDSLNNGASGFLLKHSSPERIVDALRTVHKGDMPLDPAMTRSVVGIYPRLPRALEDHKRERLPSLSEREGQIVALLARGMSTAEVARRLHLSTTTVKTHISHILTKWNLRDRVQLVARAYETGFAQQFPLEADTVPSFVRTMASRPNDDEAHNL